MAEEKAISSFMIKNKQDRKNNIIIEVFQAIKRDNIVSHKYY